MSAQTLIPPTEPLPPDAIVTGSDGDMPATSSGHLTDAEMDQAEALEAAANARERAAIAESLRRRNRGQAADLGVDVNAPLSVRAAHEYAYVARDVRHIILTASVMVGILAVLAILINVMGVIAI
jgi:hypothetical protein